MTFGIIGNVDKKGLSDIILSIIKFLDRKKISYVIEKEAAWLVKKNNKYPIAQRKIVKDTEIPRKCDYLISAGGDGTFLYSAKIVGKKNIPIIGVNLGKLGFLAETSTKEINKFITDIVNNKFKTEQRTVLQAYTSQKPERKIFGLNEIVIGQTGTVKTIEIRTYYNNKLINIYLADGLIVSTPTGSTGYALSAGGPIVVPVSDVLIIVPLSPHTLTARPVILPDSGKLKIKVISRVPIVVTADGYSKFSLKGPSEILISLADYRIKVLKSLSSNYFSVLNRKLFWGRDVRRSRSNSITSFNE
jgi:NAD+ kinase